MSSMPVIQDYSFGRMTIGLKTFTSDLVILPNGTIKENWRRRQGHFLIRQDLALLLDLPPPDIIVIGTGAYTRMQVDPNLISHLDSLGIKADLADSQSAVQKYNRLRDTGVALGACFHLTC